MNKTKTVFMILAMTAPVSLVMAPSLLPVPQPRHIRCVQDPGQVATLVTPSHQTINVKQPVTSVNVYQDRAKIFLSYFVSLNRTSSINHV